MRLAVFFASFFFVFVSSVYAGGGRIVIENMNGAGVTGNIGLPIGARLYNDAEHTSTVTGEKAEFRIINPRAGDKCTTRSTTVNEYGQIFGECFKEEPGTITIYVHSLDRGDDSSQYLLTFYQLRATPTPTSEPTRVVSTPTMTPEKETVISVSPESTISTPSATSRDDSSDATKKPEIVAAMLAVGVVGALYYRKEIMKFLKRMLKQSKRSR